MQVANPYIRLTETGIYDANNAEVSLENLTLIAKDMAEAENLDIENINEFYEGVYATVLECPVVYDEDGHTIYIGAELDGQPLVAYLSSKHIGTHEAEREGKPMLCLDENTIAIPLAMSVDADLVSILFIARSK